MTPWKEICEYDDDGGCLGTRSGLPHCCGSNMNKCMFGQQRMRCNPDKKPAVCYRWVCPPVQLKMVNNNMKEEYAEVAWKSFVMECERVNKIK